MANRSEAAGREYLREAQAVVAGQVDGDGEAAGSSTEVGGRGTAWEQMLEALTRDDDSGAPNDGAGSLRASIAERLNTRGASPANVGEAPDVRPVRRRRR